ncbi:MAG: rRNA methyltransferase [Clostridia bacterium]|nr:rRNA methyltransferase [Clostridia bacterium]
MNDAVSAVISDADAAKLAKDARTISENYRLRTGSGARLLTKESEALAYAASRMPATAAAAYDALSRAIDAAGIAPNTLLDCGAGTGAASWAADVLIDLESVTCLEREDAMRAVGQRLMALSGGALSSAQWASWDLTDKTPLPRAGLVVEGYMLGELAEGMRMPAARRLWDATGEMLLLIEPGTPQGFANLNAVREYLCGLGAYVAAPCPAGAGKCPMKGDDWCHFTVRVQRTKVHKLLKGGDAPYEDEKFAYLALTREMPKNACAARVLRHPQIAPGRIVLELCEEGKKTARTVTKKDPLWKRARKIGAGDEI